MVVYVVLKNADFTEGRGPMLFHKVFASRVDAENYCFQNLNPYNSPDPVRQGFASIKPAELIESYDAEAVAKKQEKKAMLEEKLKKLQEEIKALGSW